MGKISQQEDFVALQREKDALSKKYNKLKMQHKALLEDDDGKQQDLASITKERDELVQLCNEQRRILEEHDTFNVDEEEKIKKKKKGKKKKKSDRRSKSTYDSHYQDFDPSTEFNDF